MLYVRGGIIQLFKLTALPAPRSPREHDRPTAKPPQPEIPPPGPGISQAALDALYIQARAELRVKHYDRALKSLRELLALDPSHPEASDPLERAEHGYQLAQTYACSRAAEERSDWGTAIREYDAVLQTNPAYQDAEKRREHCRKQRQVTDRQAELRYHYDAGNWQAVLDVDAELASLDPASADPDSLTTKAREHLHKAELESRYQQARADEEAHAWAAAAQGYGDILRIDPSYKDAAARHSHVKAADLLMARVKADLDILLAERCRRAATRRESAVEHAQPPQPERLPQAPACHVPKPRVLNVGQWALCVAISLDGTRLAVGSRRRVRVWDLRSGRLAWEARVGGWIDAVWGVAFSPDGTRLATASDDTTVRITGTAEAPRQRA